MFKCTGYKFTNPGNSLQSLYKIAKHWLSTL